MKTEVYEAQQAMLKIKETFTPKQVAIAYDKLEMNELINPISFDYIWKEADPEYQEVYKNMFSHSIEVVDFFEKGIPLEIAFELGESTFRLYSYLFGKMEME